MGRRRPSVGRFLTRWLIPLPAILLALIPRNAVAEVLPICPPTNLSALDSGAEIVLDWVAPSCGKNQPERFAIFFTTGDNGGWAVATGNVGDDNALNTDYAFAKSFFEGFGFPANSIWRFSVRSDNDTLSLYSSMSNEVSIAIDYAVTTTTTTGSTTTLLQETTTTTASTTTIPEGTTTWVQNTTSTTTTTTTSTTVQPTTVLATTTTMTQPSTTISTTTTTAVPELLTTTTSQPPLVQTTTTSTTTTQVPETQTATTTTIEVTPTTYASATTLLAISSTTLLELSTTADSTTTTTTTFLEPTTTVDTQLVMPISVPNEISAQEATKFASSAKVLQQITQEQATEVFAALDLDELQDNEIEQIVNAVQSAPAEVRQAFETEINIFDGKTDSYVPLGSTVSVGARRVLVAVTGVLIVGSVATSAPQSHTSRKNG